MHTKLGVLIDLVKVRRGFTHLTALLKNRDKDRDAAISAVVELIRNCSDKFTCLTAIEILIGVDSETAINVLSELIDNSQDPLIIRQAMSTLIELIRDSKDDDVRRRVPEILGKIGRDNDIAINRLIELIVNSKDDDFHRRSPPWRIFSWPVKGCRG